MPLTRMPPVRAIAGLVILRYDNLMVLLCSGAVRTSATCGRGDAQVKNGCSATSRNSQENHAVGTLTIPVFVCTDPSAEQYDLKQDNTHHGFSKWTAGESEFLAAVRRDRLAAPG